MLHGRGARESGRILAVVCAVGIAVAGACMPAFASEAGLMRQTAATSSAAASSSAPQSAMHTISVAFNYDFTKTPACNATVTKNCVAKFQVFDISLPEKPYLLFTIAVPEGATGKKNLIKAASPRLSFVIGKHRLGVSAVTVEGLRSDPALCSTIVTVGPSTTN